MFYRIWVYLKWRWQQRGKRKYPKTGLYWHIHHTRLCEECYSYRERAKNIIFWKEKAEIKRRLELFTPVKGEVPDRVVGYRRAFCPDEDAFAALEALHRKEHPDCPWNYEGEYIIFSPAKEAK